MRIPQVDGPITMDDLGVPPAPISGYPYIYTHIYIYIDTYGYS